MFTIPLYLLFVYKWFRIFYCLPCTMYVMVLRKILHVCLIGVALYASIVLLDGVSLTTDSYGFLLSFIFLFIVLFVVELVIYPVVNLVILPLRFVSFGFASLALSIALVYFVEFFIPFFSIASFWQLMLIGVVFGIIRGVLR